MSFQVCHSKLNSTFDTNLTYLNEILIFVKLRGREPIKICHFSIFKVNFPCQKSAESFWKWFSRMNIWIVEQLLLRTFHDRWHFWSTFSLKMCPIFNGSLPSNLKECKISFSQVKLASKVEFNFGWHTWKLHYQNCSNVRGQQN